MHGVSCIVLYYIVLHTTYRTEGKQGSRVGLDNHRILKSHN